MPGQPNQRYQLQVRRSDFSLEWLNTINRDPVVRSPLRPDANDQINPVKLFSGLNQKKNQNNLSIFYGFAIIALIDSSFLSWIEFEKPFS